MVTAMQTTKQDMAEVSDQEHLRTEVEKLAAEAFHQHLISGYGDGESPDEYQIVIQGKPRHYSLEYAHSLLTNLVEHQISLAE
jgi:hypothetical protein